MKIPRLRNPVARAETHASTESGPSFVLREDEIVNRDDKQIWFAAGVRTPFAKVDALDLGDFPSDRLNPNGGSVAIVGLCTDGGHGAVVLLESADGP